MKQYLFGILVLLFLFGASPVRAQEVGEEEIVKIETTLVSVPVVVSDRDGRYVPNLKAGDFTVFQDGEKQKIEFFAAEEEPANVALVLDTSPSTAGVIDQIKRAALDFTRLLRPEDRAMVVTFDTSTQFLSPMTSDRIELERAIRSADIGPYIGTIMRDAVREVVERGFKNLKGRKAIILLTDGQDFGSRFDEDELLDMLEESDVMIYTVYYQTEPANNFGRRRGRGRFGRRLPGGNGGRRREARRERAVEYLERMSELTAGRFYNKDVTDLSRTFAIIADELRKQYRLGFYPAGESSAGDVHQIKVRVGRENVSVRSRSSYRTAR
ncbi:MAG: VWA domain-containing protein [Pyrinomonadaceae bacterium]